MPLFILEKKDPGLIWLKINCELLKTKLNLQERLSMTKLKWGMIGGGEGSQIGPAHRLGAVADGRFELVAGALDHRPAKGKAFAESLGIESSRAYGSWSEMLDGE